MGRKKILVVDDDSILSKMIDISLTRRGHNVKVSYSGVEAVKYLFEEKPDLMVLDIRLPDCDGWFLVKLFKKLEWAEKIPLIIISVLEPDRGKVAEAKPDAYIQKPFDIGQLMQTIERSLSMRDALLA